MNTPDDTWYHDDSGDPPQLPVLLCIGIKIRKRLAPQLCAADKDVVHGDVYQLDEVPNGTHDKETHSDGLADLDEFTLVGLGASLDEQRTVADKVLGDIGELLEIVGHYGGISRGREGDYYKREGEESYKKELSDSREVQVNKELNVKRRTEDDDLDRYGEIAELA